LTEPSSPRWHQFHCAWYSRGYLPHFDQPGQYQFVTFRLHDSIPAAAREKIRASASQGSEAFHEALDTALDSGWGSCWLKREDIATVVEDALLFFDNQRYKLLHWVIMPNHVHALLRSEPGFPLGNIMHSWKSFTAKAANKILGRTGDFWQPDYFDRWMRDEAHYQRTAAYIENNPVKAGLVTLPEAWRFSSAYARSILTA
jgi:putative transposase